MIYDLLKNSRIYYGIHSDIEIGLKYLERISSNVEVGEYMISNNVKAIVSEYLTTKEKLIEFEAHKKYIDIQFPIKGRERIKWSCVNGMEEITSYDSEKDTTFLRNPQICTNIDIGNGFFSIFFPLDAHSPQHYIDSPEFIKKITLKIKSYVI
ncbi:MAG: YhcH/YjgK/YiaL family protein [Ignavibacteriaceae bacterium]